MQKLPIGIQHFNRLRQEGYLYVDKTQQIHTLINTGTFLFLSRPRRFGKSLLTTTLRELYLGNRTLFQGLWIEDKIDWQPRPVILLNFNDLDYLEQPLADALTLQMERIAAEHQLTLQAEHYKDRFQELITRLAEHQKIVLLIDEYDKPITDLLENEQKVAEHVATLKNFYSVFKSTAAEHIHFALLTGVSKYGKISLFSDLNNLIDITMDRRFATLLGYTQAELEHYFADYIDRLAETFKLERSEMLQWIKYWYNGYSWDGVQQVYVPFSTMLFLERQTFENYWFSTGTPSFLIKLLRQEQIAAYELQEVLATDGFLDSADVNDVSVLSLLFQTGYLTVKQIHPAVQGYEYVLGYPNHEVQQAFQQYLLADYLNRSVALLTATILSRLQQALRKQNIQTFIDILNTVFASIPYTLFLPQEAYYHSIVYLILKLLGFAIRAEPLTSQGRIDAVLELGDKVYILEFKMTTAQVALDQIKARGYDQPYHNQGKTIILLGIAFDKEQRAIGDWQSELA
ncbi:MAG: ATP-binding protein [Caldilineaceae bacterium]